MEPLWKVMAPWIAKDLFFAHQIGAKCSLPYCIKDWILIFEYSKIWKSPKTLILKMLNNIDIGIDQLIFEHN